MNDDTCPRCGLPYASRWSSAECRCPPVSDSAPVTVRPGADAADVAAYQARVREFAARVEADEREAMRRVDSLIESHSFRSRRDDGA